MRSIKSNDKALPAVIGVILIVAITVAIAAIVYVYVSDMTDRLSSNQNETIVTGILQGFYEVDGIDPIIINNQNYTVYHVDTEYLMHLIGHNITLILGTSVYDDYDYEYIGAYLTLD